MEQKKELPSSRHSGIFGTIASRDFDGDELGLREGRSCSQEFTVLSCKMPFQTAAPTPPPGSRPLSSPVSGRSVGRGVSKVARATIPTSSFLCLWKPSRRGSSHFPGLLGCGPTASKLCEAYSAKQKALVPAHHLHRSCLH